MFNLKTSHPAYQSYLFQSLVIFFFITIFAAVTSVLNNAERQQKHKSDLQSAEPFAGEFWSTTNRLVPYNGESSDTAEVLCNRDCTVKVDDNVPPATRYEHRLTRALQYLHLSHHKHCRLPNYSTCSSSA